MFRALTVMAAGIGFLGAMLAALPAQAQTLATPGNITVGGFKYTWFGAASGSCTTTTLCGNAQVVANVTNTGIELRPVTGALVSAGGDLSVLIQIDSLTGAPINSYGVSTAGTTTGPTLASTGVNIYAADGFTNIGAVTAAVGASNSVALSTAAAGTKVFGSIDARGNSGSINIVGITVTSVPEPATLAVFGTGLLGLAALRRRRQR